MQYTEADLYKQLSYFCHVLDATRFLEKVKICLMFVCIALSTYCATIYWNYMAAVGTKSYGACWERALHDPASGQPGSFCDSKDPWPVFLRMGAARWPLYLRLIVWINGYFDLFSCKQQLGCLITELDNLEDILQWSPLTTIASSSLIREWMVI